MTRAYAPRGDRVETTYLGYPLEITNSDVTIYDKHGRKLATVASGSAARRFIRGYRRTPSNVEATARPREESAAASTRNGD